MLLKVRELRSVPTFLGRTTGIINYSFTALSTFYYEYNETNIGWDIWMPGQDERGSQNDLINDTHK